MRYIILLFSFFISAAHAQEARISYGISGSVFLSPITSPRPTRTPGDYGMISNRAFATGIWCAYQFKPRFAISLNANYVHRGITTYGDIVDSTGLNNIGIQQNKLPLRGFDAILMFNYLHPLPNQNKLILGIGIGNEYFNTLPNQTSFHPNADNLLYSFVDNNNANNTIHLDTDISRWTVLGEIGIQSSLASMGKIRLTLNYELSAGRDLHYYHMITPEPIRAHDYIEVDTWSTFRTIQARLVWVIPPFKSKKSESQ